MNLEEIKKSLSEKQIAVIEKVEAMTGISGTIIVPQCGAGDLVFTNNGKGQVRFSGFEDLSKKLTQNKPK